MTWLMANRGTIIVLLILAAAVVAVLRSLFKKKKQGQSACGCSCGSCPMECGCRRIK